MDAYIYCADMYCEECADEIKAHMLADVTARLEPKIEAAIRRLETDLGITISEATQERIRSWTIKAAMPDPDFCDSGEYPCGPYSDGGGESDHPTHCGSCQEFLENPLTSDGMVYVREHDNSMWDAFYGIERGETV
jgi:hypothetical protein